MNGPAYASCPQNVRAVDFGHVLVLIDYRTGRALSLLPPAGQQWDEASRTGALDAMDRPLAHQLLALDLLTATRSPMPWPPAAVGTSAQASWGGSEHQAGTSRPSRAPITTTLAATAALTAAFAATRHRSNGMQQALALLTAASTRTTRAASPAQATAAVHAVRRAGWYCPGRTACLEESIATVLLLATRRLGVTWCHGIASDPIRLHAWVQTTTR